MEEFDFREILKIVWKKKIYIILLIAVFAELGILYTSYLVTPMYRSSTTLVLAQSASDSNTKNTVNTITTTDITLNSKLIATYSELIKSKSVVRQVISNLGITVDEKKLERNINVKARENTEVIEITVANENKAYATLIANELANVFAKKVAEIYNINNVNIVDKAEDADEPYNIHKGKTTFIFAFIGVAISGLYVIAIYMLDNTVKNTDKIEKELEVPVLAVIPIYGGKIKSKGGRK